MGIRAGFAIGDIVVVGNGKYAVGRISGASMDPIRGQTYLVLPLHLEYRGVNSLLGHWEKAGDLRRATSQDIARVALQVVTND